MREILFKAKRIDNGEWVEGYLVETRHNTYFDGYRIIDKDGINYDELDYYDPSFISYVIDKTTICQFTGLTDKNGNKIWENDVVDLHGYGFGIGNIEIVSYKDGGFYPFMISKWECTPDSEDVEVIGNIFDNPELINE